jgi:hypothetical protein
MTRTEIINILIKKFNYKSYLEIGCNKNKNFEQVKATIKVGVDPHEGGTIRATSDDFFKTNKMFFDIVFIDGLHHANQVYKDIANSLKYSNPKGTIVVHDCNPRKYSRQIVPRPVMQRRWNGNVWKGWLKLRSEREDLEMFVVADDEGCGIIRVGRQNLIKKWDIDYDEFKKSKKELLNLISANEFLQYIDNIPINKIC